MKARSQPLRSVSVETSSSFRGHRIVGGNLAIDLLNTRDLRADGAPGGDVLADYDDIVAWALHMGVVSDVEADRLRGRARRHPAEAAAAFARVVAARDSLDHLFRAVAHGETPAAADLARLARDEADGLGHARLIEADGGVRWSWADDTGLDRPLWPIVHAALGLVLDGPLDRVKGCATCSFLFVDESRNRSRRWCSMDDCGTRAKMRSYVTRRRAARAEPLPPPAG
jgi:predicted RNA-binding Zn ribbon-like protein